MSAVIDQNSVLRKALHSTVSVFDRNTNRYIGLVAQYTPEGVVVASSFNPIAVGQKFTLTIVQQSPRRAEDTTRGDFDAVSVWCERTSASFYGAGFRIEKLTADALKLLEYCRE